MPRGVYIRTKPSHLKGKVGWRKNQPLSEEHREKIRLANLGRLVSQDTRDKLRKANLGKKMLPEVRSKLLGRKMSEDTKRKMSLVRKGKSNHWLIGKSPANKGIPSPRRGTILSEETKSKISISNKGKPSWMKGQPAHNRGKPSFSVREKNIIRYGAYDKYIIENPPHGYRFIPEFPYDEFPKGVVLFDKTHGRRNVQFSNENGKTMKSTRCAVYLYDIDLYKRKKQLRPKGWQVHHKSHDKMDDRYANLEALPQTEHMRKHLLKRAMLICPIDKIMFEKYVPEEKQDFSNPVCCSSRCRVTLDVTLQPASEYVELRKWMAQHQILNVPSDWEFADFNLHKVIGRPVSYGSWDTAPEAERIQRMKDAIVN